MSALGEPHSTDEIKTLEQVRARLHTLVGGLNTLIAKLQYMPEHDPLPPWQSLQNTTFDLTRNLQAIQTILTDTKRSLENPYKPTNLEFLRSAHVHTLPTFPGAQQKNMLYTLLRKKLDLPVEDWLRDVTKAATPTDDASKGEGKLRSEDLHALWDWAGEEANKIARRELLGLADGEDEGSDEGSENDDDEDAMEGVQVEGTKASDALQEQTAQRRGSVLEREPEVHARKMMDLTQILPFALTGTLGNAPVAPVRKGK